jgi:hypothetical protein
MDSIGNKLFDFFSRLTFEHPQDSSIEVLNPFSEKLVLDINRIFYDKYYSDKSQRVLILGINPGRFGAGVTGISFTDPVALEKNLQIENTFTKVPELSATFIHNVIQVYGGPDKFFEKFILSAVCPLGFTKNHLNINYYDDKSLFASAMPFIIKTLKIQREISGGDQCICIGKGKNFEILREINSDQNIFNKIYLLPHPRWILQYHRKEESKYISDYIETLRLF